LKRAGGAKPNGAFVSCSDPSLEKAMKREEAGKKIGKVISKAWADEKFKQRLLADTMAVLKEEGIEVQANMEVRAVEQTEKLVYLVIPQTPRPDITDERLLAIATNRFRATTQHCDTDCTSIGGTI
jgi:hypothetical protein